MESNALATLGHNHVEPGRLLGHDQVELIKRTIAKGATNDELQLFISICNRTQLDPFARQIYAIKRWDSTQQREVMQTQVSIDGARLVAERSGKYAGQVGPLWTGDGKEWVDVWLAAEHPVAAKVAILRSDFKEPLWSVATWDAYCQKKRDGAPTSMWLKMGALMLAKCAEMLSLRKGFPAELSGLYSAEEMSQAETPATEMPAGDRQQPTDTITPEQWRALVAAAKSKLGVDDAKAWIATRLDAAGAKRGAELKAAGYATLMGELLTMGRGEETQDPDPADTFQDGAREPGQD